MTMTIRQASTLSQTGQNELAAKAYAKLLLTQPRLAQSTFFSFKQQVKMLHIGDMWSEKLRHVNELICPEDLYEYGWQQESEASAPIPSLLHASVISVFHSPAAFIVLDDLLNHIDVLKALLHRLTWGSSLILTSSAVEIISGFAGEEYYAQRSLYPSKSSLQPSWLRGMRQCVSPLTSAESDVLSSLGVEFEGHDIPWGNFRQVTGSNASKESCILQELVESVSSQEPERESVHSVITILTQKHRSLLPEMAMEADAASEDWSSKAVSSHLFSKEFYLATNPDLPLEIDGLSHYAQHGWREGRDPSQYFSTSAYNAVYQDVYAAGICPLQHYVQHGYDRQRFSSSYFEKSRSGNPESVDLSLIRVPGDFNARQIKIAILIHIHYSTVLSTMLASLEGLDLGFDLLISVTSQDVLNQVLEVLDSYQLRERATVRLSVNRGRDVGAFINCFTDIYMNYDLICKIHGKQSPHLKEFGDRWCRYLISSSIGSQDLIHKIIYFLSSCPKVGVFAPVPFEGTNNNDWAGNLDIARNLVSDSFDCSSDDLLSHPLAYPSATVFWFRPSALIDLYGRFTPEDFPPEPLPNDGTIAHAIERLIPYFARRQGYSFLCYKDRRSEISCSKEYAIQNFLADKLSSKKRVLLFSHDASNTGAPRTAIGIHSALNQSDEYECLAIVLGDGPLVHSFNAAGATVVFPYGICKDVLSDIFRASDNILTVICNTCVTAGIAMLARNHGHYAISLVHEYASAGYWPKEFFIDALQSDVTIFPGPSVLEKAVGYATVLPSNELVLQPQGIYRDTFPEVTNKDSRESVRKELGITADSLIILGCGMLEHRKGIDLFIDVALAMCREKRMNTDPVCFLWIGSIPSSEKDFADSQIQRLNESGFSSASIRVLSDIRKTDRYFAASDIFFLSSRFDPFPGVVLEAMACSLPIICFGFATDVTSAFVNHCGGIALEALDTSAVVSAITRLINNDRLRQEMGAFGAKRLRLGYTFESYMKSVTSRLAPRMCTADHTRHDMASPSIHTSSRPSFSIVVPAYNTPISFLQQMIHSVINQSYQDFELIIAASNFPESALCLLEFYANMHPAVKPLVLEDNLGIAGNTNVALGHASGSHICLLDHDDLLHAKCLERISQCIHSTSADFIYTDEDKVDLGGGVFHSPVRKPEFSHELIERNNFITHLTVVSRELLDKTGLMRSAYDGAQDYDFILRATEMADDVVHIPEVLYHWRESQDSTSSGLSDAKPYAIDAGRRALEARLIRQGRSDERVNLTTQPFVYDVGKL